MHVAEFTLHAKPGHFQQLAEVYSEFATNFLSDHPALESVLILGDEAAGGVRGLQRSDRAASGQPLRAGRARAPAPLRQVARRTGTITRMRPESSSAPH